LHGDDAWWGPAWGCTQTAPGPAICYLNDNNSNNTNNNIIIII